MVKQCNFKGWSEKSLKIHRWVSCGRKKRYNSESDSFPELNRLREKHEEWLRHSIYSYECVFCGGWHIGNDKTAQKRALGLYEINSGMKTIKEALTKQQKKILGRYIGYLIQLDRDRNAV